MSRDVEAAASAKGTLRLVETGPAPDTHGRAKNGQERRSWKRGVKLGVLRAAKSLGMFSLMHRLTRRRVRILCYHGVWRTDDGFPGDAMFMSRATFAHRIDMLARMGLPVVPLCDAVRGMAGLGPLRDNSVVITIDDGWYSTYADMLPVLSRYNMPATIYCDTASLQRGIPVPHVMANYLMKVADPDRVTPAADRALATAKDFARDPSERLESAKALAAELGIDTAIYYGARAFDYMTPDELRDAAAAGFDIQLHTHAHTLGDHGTKKTRAEIRNNRGALADLLGGDDSRFRHFAFPSGKYTRKSVAALPDCGVVSAVSTDPGLAHASKQRLCLPRISDGEQVSDIEFEAELSGFMDVVRWIHRAVTLPRTLAVKAAGYLLMMGPIQPVLV